VIAATSFTPACARRSGLPSAGPASDSSNVCMRHAKQAHAPLFCVLGSIVWISTRSLTSTTMKLRQRRKQQLQRAGSTHLLKRHPRHASRGCEACRAPELLAAAGSAAPGVAKPKQASAVQAGISAGCRATGGGTFPLPPSPPPLAPGIGLAPLPGQRDTRGEAFSCTHARVRCLHADSSRE
jgi:hypothetical protein